MNIRLFQGLIASGAMLGMLCGVPAIAQNATAPDNTKMNQGDRAAGAPTADQAKNDKSDREIMREIHRGG